MMALTAERMKRKFDEQWDNAPELYNKRTKRHEKKKPSRGFIGMTIDELIPELKGTSNGNVEYDAASSAIRRAVKDYHNGAFDGLKNARGKFRLPGAGKKVVHSFL